MLRLIVLLWIRQLLLPVIHLLVVVVVDGTHVQLVRFGQRVPAVRRSVCLIVLAHVDAIDWVYLCHGVLLTQRLVLDDRKRKSAGANRWRLCLKL